MSWTSIQLGSREHYAIPAALHEAGRLDCCITDSWLNARAANLVRPFFPSLAGRRHKRLPNTKVRSNTLGRLVTDFRLKRRHDTSWSITLERNEWFGAWAARQSADIASSVVFSYSYTARRPFAEAHARGATCVLGQIDPGPLEEEVVLAATAKYRHLASPSENAPRKYWDLWCEEVELADKIIINSPWSAKLLVEVGVPSEKLVEIPLVYELPESSVGSGQSSANQLVTRHSPPVTGSGPRLQALFLGSVILRKGVGQLFDAIRMLKNEPVDFTFAGPIGVKIPDEVSQLPNVRFLGPVDKATAERLYRESDVFLFPTLSDGFGLTQLEALGHGLPVIASLNCGRVIEHELNGLLLPEVTPESIAEAVDRCARDPALIHALRAGAHVSEANTPAALLSALSTLPGQR